MSQFGAFLPLGFHHITAPGALDHLLFLLALVAPYRFRDWRHLLTVASAFTIGHSLTLALLVTDVVRLPTALVEFLIPLTIIGASLANLRRGRRAAGGGWTAPLLAGGFGLIHGAGFASVLRALFQGPVALPLFAFNLGIELGQLVVLAGWLVLLTGIDSALLWVPAAGRWPRAALPSLTATAGAILLAVQRIP